MRMYTVECRQSSGLLKTLAIKCLNDNWNFLRKYDVPVLGWLRSNIIHRRLVKLEEIQGVENNTQSTSVAEKCASGKYIVKPDELLGDSAFNV